jgi:hypothetical protein
MPPEMMRIESGSAMTASAMTAPVVFAVSGTSDTASKNFEAEKAASQKVFLHSHSFQPLRGFVTEQDTVVGEPHAKQIITVLAALQEGLQQWQMVFQPLQEQLVSALQPLQEQLAFLDARLAAVVWNPLQGQLFSFSTFLQAGLLQGQMERQALQEQIASSQKAKEGTGAAGLSPMVIEIISPTAAQRLRGHERIVQAVCSLAKGEARARGLALLNINVRPAWSHEYDERTGVVIDVEIKAGADERFSYWDAMCERLNQLEDTLSPEDRSFLTSEISFIVSRS